MHFMARHCRAMHCMAIHCTAMNCMAMHGMAKGASIIAFSSSLFSQCHLQDEERNDHNLCEDDGDDDDKEDWFWCAYLAALAGVDAIVEAGRLVSANSAQHTVVPVKF